MHYVVKIRNKIKSIIKNNKLKKIAFYKEIDGWLTSNEAVVLYSIARKLNKNSLSLEIGSWKGKSTYCIAEGLVGGKLIVIDPFNASGGNDADSEEAYLKKMGDANSLLEIFIDNMKKRNVLNKIEIKKGYSQEFSNEVGTLDFLFIDGDHTIEGCKADFDLYAHKIKKGGYIAFHDYDKNRPKLGPTYVVHNHILNSNIFAFFGLFDSLWVGVKVRDD